MLVENPGNFLDRQILRVMKPEGGIGIGRKPFLGELPERPEAKRLFRALLLHRAFRKRDLPSTVSSTDRVEGKPAGNREKPRSKGLSFLVELDLSEGPQESFLGHVLG